MQRKPAGPKEPTEGSKQAVEGERLDRLEAQVRDLEKRVFELENSSADSTSTP